MSFDTWVLEKRRIHWRRHKGGVRYSFFAWIASWMGHDEIWEEDGR